MNLIYPYSYLTYLGALPFIFCAASLTFGINYLPVFGDTLHALLVYCLLIASFMAGSHWGQHLHLNDKWAVYLSMLSNFIVVTLYIGFSVLAYTAQIGLFVLAFVLLLNVDYKLFKHGLITSHYFRTRCIVTGLVVITLIISGVAII